ncbi:hypothetical protein [Leucobacter denitrificans]|uniref:Uncharacterized protein n=1 Tax=Leucobacter denitrificans TaxID=683042 RepID=A0A7G9S6U4_9MICO|nr:hypothetical protein [Leucobacter denitrificans]QNN63569.1 hypothetical protein H9L06_04455 [Leucobacter denitrificans]
MASLSARLSAMLVIAWFTVVGLTGCSAVTAPVESTPGPVTSKDSPEPSSVPEEEPEQLATTQLPNSCVALLPASVLQRADPRIEMFDTSDEVIVEQMRLQVGPLTMATLHGGDQQLYCSFGIRQTDGGGSIGVAVIDELAKSELLDALRSSVYVEVDLRDAEAAFFQGASADHPYTEDIVIDGDVLIAVPHTVGGDFAWDALATIREAR